MWLRCGLRPLEFVDAATACRTLATLKVDAVVLNGHDAQLKQLSAPIETMLQVLTDQASIGAGGALVVLTASEVASPLLQAYRAAGATFLKSDRQTYREIALAVRRLSGLPAGCCK